VVLALARVRAAKEREVRPKLNESGRRPRSE
jgi:hypothetical protein